MNGASTSGRFQTRAILGGKRRRRRGRECNPNSQSPDSTNGLLDHLFRDMGPHAGDVPAVTLRDDAGTTRLRELWHHDPMRVLLPEPVDDSIPHVVLLNTAGGLVGGDSLRTEIEVGDRARALVTGQAAEVEPPPVEPDDDDEGAAEDDDVVGAVVEVVVDEVELPPEPSPEPEAFPEPPPARESVR